MHRPGMHVDRCWPLPECRFRITRMNKLEYGNEANFPINYFPRIHVEGSTYTIFYRTFRVVLVGVYLNCISFLASLPALMPFFFIQNNNKTLTI